VQLKDLANRIPRPRPRKHDFVFVVTYGRSGSTLSQGLLNSLPRTLVRGENGFYLHHHYRAWAGVSEFQIRYAENGAKKGPRSAFYGIDEVDTDAFIASSRDLAVRQLLGAKRASEVDRLGFKEVLWHRIEEDETEDFFRWFEMVFPDAKYVLNRREHDNVASSGFWRKQERDQVMRAIHRVEEVQKYLLTTRPDRTLETQYERVTSEDSAVSDAELSAIAEFVLGHANARILARMRKTRAGAHGPRPFGRSRNRSRNRD
jgi:hypothetical protein